MKQGEADDFFTVARGLVKAVPLHMVSKSKAERGYYALVNDRESEAVAAEPIALSADADWVMAFKIIARACLFQFAANEAGLRDAEAVHQMRIGMRRLRAAISLFKDILADRQTNSMKTEFKWISKELFMKRVVKYAGSGAARTSDMAAVAEDVRKRRAQAMRRAQAAVSSPRFQRLVLNAAAWIEIGDWTRNDDELARTLRERSLTDAATEELRRRRNEIRKQGRCLAELDPRHRHKLRIRAKKLRYACEFFATAFTGKKRMRRRKKFIARLKRMQDALGDLNDILVHTELAQRAIAPSAGERRTGRRAKKAFAAGRLSGREEARFATVMKDARRAHAAFLKTTPFWQ